MRVTKDYAATLSALNTALTFQQQADATLSQANPVSATLYTILNTSQNARIISAVSQVTWAVTQPTPLVLVVTIDGQSIVHSQTNPVSAPSQYAAERTNYVSALAQGMRGLAGAIEENISPFLYEGRNVKIEARITWAVTQPTSLVGLVKWAKR